MAGKNTWNWIISLSVLFSKISNRAYLECSALGPCKGQRDALLPQTKVEQSVFGENIGIAWSHPDVEVVLYVQRMHPAKMQQLLDVGNPVLLEPQFLCGFPDGQWPLGHFR